MSSVLSEEQIKKILRQVEFYFSDSNLPRDKFLRTTVEESDDGLVALSLICSFARMRSHLGLGKSDDIPEETVLSVAEVLRKSSSLRVSEDGKKIGRSTELVKPEEVIEQVDSRTVAASPFPYDIKIEEVQAFFGQKGKVNSVRLPRHVGDAKAFCGTTLIEFSEEEDAKRILQEKLVYAGADLDLTSKSDFDAERAKQMEGVKRNRSNKDSSAGRNDMDSESEKKTVEVKGNQHNKESSEESYPKGVIVAFRLTPMPAVESAKENVSEIVKDVEEVKDVELSKSSEIAEATENIETEEKPLEDAGVEEEEKKGAEDIDVENEETAATGSPPINEDKVESEEKDATGSPPINEEKVESEEKDATGSPPINEDKVEKDSPTDDGEKVKGGEITVTREDLKKVFGKFGNVMMDQHKLMKKHRRETFIKAGILTTLAATAAAIHIISKEPIDMEANNSLAEAIFAVAAIMDRSTSLDATTDAQQSVAHAQNIYAALAKLDGLDQHETLKAMDMLTYDIRKFGIFMTLPDEMKIPWLRMQFYD